MNDSTAKRAFDVALALAGMVAFAPLAAIIAVAIKLDDGGPILYSQRRWGRGGKVFRAYKFRSMIQNAGEAPAIKGDPRITRLGRYLRATAMDELPQLFNILMGEMSFVGPRALAVSEIAPDSPGFERRHSIAPGLTGPAQLFARRDASFEEKLVHDLAYIESANLRSDLAMILESVLITLRGRWGRHTS